MPAEISRTRLNAARDRHVCATTGHRAHPVLDWPRGRSGVACTAYVEPWGALVRRIGLLAAVVALLAVGTAKPADAAPPPSAVGTFDRTEGWGGGQSNIFTGRFSDGTRTYQGVAATDYYYPGLPHADSPSVYHFTLTSQTPGGLAGTCTSTLAVDTRYLVEYPAQELALVVLGTVGPLLPAPLGDTLSNLVLPRLVGTFTPTDKFTCQLAVNGGPVTTITWYAHLTSYSSTGPDQAQASGVFAG